MEEQEEYSSKMSDVIISEMNDCREDERNAQNMIIQVIATTGTVIGVLTGASFLGTGTDNQKRCLLFLSGIILCVGYAYIISLGISNTLRFHYLRNLEDRLSVRISQPPNEKPFINWISFSSPVLTRNIKHVKSNYTKVHFWSYVIATGLAIFFGISMLFVLHNQISEHIFWDTVMLAGFMVALFAASVVFFFSTVKSEEMYEYSLRASLEKRRERMNRESKQELTAVEPQKSRVTKDVLKVIMYYLYPRLVDIQKPFLIGIGFAIGLFLKNGGLAVPSWGELGVLVMVVIIVDFLMYQARYLWNDLRGLTEDAAAGKEDRLPIHLISEKRATAYALILILCRLVLAIVLIFMLPEGLSFPIAMICLAVWLVAIFYEQVSEHNNANGVYFFVSFGYPIRVIAGMLAAWPQFASESFSFGGTLISPHCLIPFYVALGLLGVFSSLLSWTHKAVDQMQKKRTVYKGYYRPLVKKLGNRITKPMPLREKGRLSDHWNVVFLLAILCLSAVSCMVAFEHGDSLLITLSEALLLVCAGFFVLADKGKATIFLVLFGALVCAKAVIGFAVLAWYPLHIFVCIVQFLFAVLYFFLRFIFDINYSFIALVTNILIALVKIVVGKETFEYLSGLK